jgi:hypothetical protein
MSKNPQLEKDYNDDNSTIQRKAQEEIKKIKEEIEKVKKEAKEISENLESEISKSQSEE